MNRRDFIKAFSFTTGASPFVAGAGVSAISIVLDKVHSWTPSGKKEAIIAKALETEEGRRALAEAMVAPIKKGMEKEMGKIGAKKSRLMSSVLTPEETRKYEDKCIETANRILEKSKNSNVKMTRAEEGVVLVGKRINERRKTASGKNREVFETI